MESGEIYDDVSANTETISDIRKIRERFEQKPPPLTRPKPTVKPKQLNANLIPDIPVKKSIVVPKSANKTGKLNGLPTPFQAARTGNENIKPGHVILKTEPEKSKEGAGKISAKVRVIGADGNIYQRLPKPTVNPKSGPPKPKRPLQVMLPEYAATEDDDLYDDVGMPSCTPGITVIRPISIIPTMTEEEELEFERGRASKLKPSVDYNPEDYDDVAMAGDDIYESFDDEG